VVKAIIGISVEIRYNQFTAAWSSNDLGIWVGCFIGKTFVGALAYADDIVLVTPSASAMRKLLRICDVYAAEYCISFNANIILFSILFYF